jgi:predicted RNase H-like HicB family nuclease
MEFDVVIRKDQDGYFVASVPSLPGCHTQARSLEELALRIKEAIALCQETGGDEKPGGFGCLSGNNSRSKGSHNSYPLKAEYRI